jgi:hypothetical protein
MNKPDERSWNWSGWGLLLLVNLIALSFFFSPGTGDVWIWGTWMSEIANHGLIAGFASAKPDYPPLAFAILDGVVKCAEGFGTTQLVILKCSLLLFLFATTGCFYWFARNLVLTAVLELSLILSSVALGYLDIYFAPFLIGGLFLLQRQHLKSGFLLYAISCAIKWQPLIIAPFVCLYVLSAGKGKTGSLKIRTQLAPFALSVLLLVIPILAVFGVPAFFDSFKRALTYHKFLSGYALNLPWIETWALHLFNPDKYPYGHQLQQGIIDYAIVREPLVVWPNKVLFYLSYGAILFAFVRQTKTFERLILYSMLGYFAYFSFNTGVHENHLFLLSCLAWILAFIEPAQLLRAINFAVAMNANLFLFYGAFGSRLNPVVAGFDITLLFAAANICLFAGFLVHTFKTDDVSWRFWRMSAS